MGNVPVLVDAGCWVGWRLRWFMGLGGLGEFRWREIEVLIGLFVNRYTGFQ